MAVFAEDVARLGKMGPGIYLDSGKGDRCLTKSTVDWVAAEPSNPIDPTHHHS